MFKIWAKTVSGDKITRDLLYTKQEKFDITKFLDYVIGICYELDIPTPLILPVHIKNFLAFGIVRFKQDDFVEPVDFKQLILENAG